MPTPRISGSGFAVTAPSSAAADGPSRQKRWAPRSRSGCFTCRAGRVRCDEAKPVCGRCVRLCKPCAGYGIVIPTSSITSSTAVYDARARRQRICLETVPPNWDHMEAIRFYVTHFLPAQSAHLPQPRLRTFDTWSHLPVSFICSMISQQIQWSCASRGRMPRPGGDPALAPAWAKYFHYYRELLGVTNESIQDRGRHGGKYRALYCIFALFCMDIKADEPLWQAHLNGGFAYVDKLGGLDAVVGFPPSLSAYVMKDLKHMLLQVRGLVVYTDGQMTTIIQSGIIIQPPIPADIFIAIAGFTQLRIQAATSDSVAESVICDAAHANLTKLSALDPEAWAREHGLGDYPLVAATVLIFRVAAHLYGALALPAARSVKFPLRTLRKKLFALLGAIWEKINNHCTLLWPLIVAGVAAADGDAQERVFVACCFETGARSRNMFVEFSRCARKMEQIWAEGKTAWEDCFREPFVCIP
ncbi:C6 finger domain protein [Cordyceps fumosorosea ARSEF 2679]|uniref:C6 finger domain protein n=1 Tax=Cordyceps fumosorosea (strain ARSEF 2679) TaxID=1081104 RepID=A0A167VT09_CORFA|nr:C6 finger domain protein [Cordyceps fumosorosea ARSEF 2679]OAA62951.1 C6 finger domain protein [Cordyceps fumosorosea ARSEF 2679]